MEHATEAATAATTPLSFAAGDRIRLLHPSTGHALELLVEPTKGGLLLARPSAPYHRLHRAAAQQHAVPQPERRRSPSLSWKPTAGNAAAIWQIDDIGAPLVRVRARRGRDEPETAPLLLTVDDDGALSLATDACWRLDCGGSGSPTSVVPRASDGDYARDGYTMLRGLVAADKLARALRLLNSHLGSASLAADLDATGLGTEYEDAEHAGGGVVKLGSGHLCTCSLAQQRDILAMVGEDERRRVAAAISSGGRQISHTFGAQVALRFPQKPFAPGVVDGEAALPGLLARASSSFHTDAAKYNDKKSFDFVLGIFLSKVATRADGSLWVVPGSHLRPAAGEASADGATAVLAAAGDAIVFHRDLTHAGGPNLSSDIRYACYYRLSWADGIEK